jgi:hypothetical protein
MAPALATATTVTTNQANIPELCSRLNEQAPPSEALEAVGARPRLAQRRPTKQASYELCNHAKAYLEGAQCMYHYEDTVLELNSWQMPVASTFSIACWQLGPLSQPPRDPTWVTSRRPLISPLPRHLLYIQRLRQRHPRNQQNGVAMPLYNTCDVYTPPSTGRRIPPYAKPSRLLKSIRGGVLLLIEAQQLVNHQSPVVISSA